MNAAVSTFRDSKQHYQTLDGLRGVAAVMVVMFHLFEVFSGGDHSKQIINHGYLAVDFFFVLSGFVIGYAYDDRWKKMTLGEFFRRRLIRLHPMIVIAMLIGAATFYLQDCSYFPLIHQTPFWKYLLTILLGCLLIPVGTSMDTRGWQEMFPLNGPAWTLFFEYIANILYALLLRQISKLLLLVLAIVAAASLVELSLRAGDVIGGWSLQWMQLRTGLTRLLYPFLAGLLLSRVAKPSRLKQSFLWCTLVLITLLSLPRLGGAQLWINGLYDAVIIILVFPLVVYLGTSRENGGRSSRASNFLGSISYPLYIIHYPFIYLFIAWVDSQKPSWEYEVAGGALVLILTISLAWFIARWYDQPVRKWLSRNQKQN